MAESPHPTASRAANLVATVFGAGNMPKAPGTWGSLVALPLAWGLQAWGGNVALAGAIVVVFALGIWSSALYMEKTGSHDPGAIVIDEVAGQWVVLLAVANPFQPDAIVYAVAFGLFRFFDIVKPWPISWADKNIKGAFGVMFDDVLAGVAGAAVLYGLVTWMGL